jgi:DNA mismatch repair protein MutS2
VNDHTLEVLEFFQVLQAVASRAGSELGREALLARRPGQRLDALRSELLRVDQTLRILRAHPDWAPPLPPDAREALRILGAEGGILDAVQLHRLGRLLVASRELATALARMEDAGGEGSGSREERLLQELRGRLPLLPEAEARIREVVDDEARIRDRASPELRRIRRKLSDARSRVVRRLEAFLGGLPERVRVPDASVSVREGRYVVPIRREGKSEVGGVILGESGTGATLFVEPPLAAQLMNELLELERDESAEIQRILREVSGGLRPHAGALGDGLAALVEFDTLWARALTARTWGASRPDLRDPGEEEIRVHGARHPLLLERGKGAGPVIPFDLELAPGERAVVVSGPNTGGKTVLLKATGLLFLLAQSGIFPPVGPGTRFPAVRRMVADIGDEQSISESLSTFSAHLANAREIVEAAGPGTLVLMDEMGTGTDPAEGAALARAILETLVERGARAVVTSHLGALKRLDEEGSGIVNASLLFDPGRIEPTYQFQKGRPGRSYGLAIARRLGFPGGVLDRAEALVDSGELDVERLLETLERKERELSQALAEGERARSEAVELREEARTRLAAVEERERTAEARAREGARRLLLEARDEVEEAIRQVRGAEAGRREEAEREARGRVEAAARTQGERTPRTPRRRRARDGGSEPLEVGDPIRLRDGGARGVVLESGDGRVTVEVGGLRLQLPVVEVEAAGPAPPGEGKRGPAQPRGGVVSAPEVEVRPEADLRGLRVDEVELELGRALDGAIMAGLQELRVIHGKGTGAVKARVQELLRADRRVRQVRPGGPGEGGGGVTIAIFSGGG